MENLRKINQARHYERHFSCKGDLVYLTEIGFFGEYFFRLVTFSEE